MQQTTHAEIDLLELAAIDGQRQRFGWVSLAAIFVSFAHMASALILFSDASWYERAAALGMTAIVDWSTWVVAEYLDYARRRKMQRSGWIKVLFAFALVISMFLNGAYLWANRPPEAQLPGWMSGGIAVAFAVFVPLLIAVASLARGELTDDRLQRQQAAHEERSARAELDEVRGAVAQLEDSSRSARAVAAQWEDQAAAAQRRATELEAAVTQAEGRSAQEVAQLRADVAQRDAVIAQAEGRAAHHEAAATHWERLAAQGQEAAAQGERASAQLRERVAQLEAELAQALAGGPLDRVAVAQRLIDLGESQRAAAQFVGLKESTLRSKLGGVRTTVLST